MNDVLVVDGRGPGPERIEVGPIRLPLPSTTVPREVPLHEPVVETFPKDDRLVTVE